MCLKSKIRILERGGLTHLKEFVVDPSIAHCGINIGDQRYGMHFVTVDVEDAARRLLPVAQTLIH